MAAEDYLSIINGPNRTDQYALDRLLKAGHAESEVAQCIRTSQARE